MDECCEKCNQEFQPWDKQYVLEVDSKGGRVAVLKTVCFLCACELVKETLGKLGINIWTRPVLDLYRLMFDDTEGSFYLHVLMKALTELYLEKWPEKPEKNSTSLFSM